MDPSIVKLFEEDEDESMHSGADVEAFQAALNRHIEGDAPISQPSDSDSVLSQGSNQTSSQSYALWQSTSPVDTTSFQSQQGHEDASQQAQSSTELEQRQPVTVSEMQQSQPNDVPHESSAQPSFPLQQNQSQDDHQPGVTEQVSSHLPQTAGMKSSEQSPIPMHEAERTNNQDSESQYLKLQKISNQQVSAAEPMNNPMNRGRQVPFALLLPAIIPQLDKDRAMQLTTLYSSLKKNEITKDGFVRHMRSVVGDNMLKAAVNQLQKKMSSEQFLLQSQAAARQNKPAIPSDSASQFGSQHSYAQRHQQSSVSTADSSHASSTAVHRQISTRYQSVENDAQKSRELELQTDSHMVTGVQVSSLNSAVVNQDRERSSVPIQGLNKQQQHIQFPPTSFPMYGSSSIHPYSGKNVTAAGSSLKPPSHDSQMRPMYHQNVGSTPIGGSLHPNMMNGPKLEKNFPQNDKKRVHGGSLSQFSNNSSVQHTSVPWPISTTSGPSSLAYVKPGSIDQRVEQHQRSHVSTPQGMASGQTEQKNAAPLIPKEEIPEKPSCSVGPLASSSVLPSRSITAQLLGSTVQSASPAVVNARTPQKKAAVGQKKPAEARGSSPPPPSKKQKVSGGFLDQGIDQLNDVTAVSGVNLREEEEQLFSGPKEDTRVSEASRRAMQEEEERLILQKIPLQKKLAEIMAKCELKNVSNDVERCLSLCVEERMRGLICSLIRFSKQRVGMEKSMHHTVVTSDIKQQIMMINRKASGEWEKKQAEVEKLRKVNEPESDTAVEGDKDKDENRAKSSKVNKEDDDKMRTTAANVAARAAVGGDDMLSKWQLMAEQARQKREGGASDGVLGSQAGKEVNRKPLSIGGRNEGHEAERGGPMSPPAGIGSTRKSGRSQARQNKVACSISVKDVISVLEREPQMSKSALIYRLYEKIRLEPAV